MYISAISPNRNYNNYSTKAKSTHPQTFKGINSEEAAERIFNIIKPKISTVKICESVRDIGPIIYELTQKWNKITPLCCSLKIVNIQEKNIPEIVGKNLLDFENMKYKCYCVVIGENKGYIDLDGCFEAVAAVIPKLGK